jgi:putative flippase GtrA
MLVFKYTFFALISTLFNLGFQWLSFRFYDGFASLYVAMFFGTLAGLLSKYILDKKWIFYHTPKDKKDDAKKFILYSFMGVFTTIIFWGTEMFFYYMIPYQNAQYIGAIIGLCIGYTIKYFLDKRFVFIHNEETTLHSGSVS